MRTYAQETNNECPEPWILFNWRESRETSEGSNYINFDWQYRSNRIIRRAWDIVNKSDKNKIRENGKELLLKISELLNVVKRAGYEIKHIKELGAMQLEDGSILIEWIFKNYRIGFNIEEDANECGWYLVTNKYMGNRSWSGLLKEENEKNRLMTILGYLIANS